MKRWLANVPVVSLIFFRLCRRNGSVYAEWRWKKCGKQETGR